MVETSDHDGHHVTSHQLGQTLERQTVDACSESFFDCAYGALNLTDMTVGRHEVEVNWTYFVAYAVEFLVGVSITRDETSRLVQFEHGAGFLQDDVLAAIVNWLCGAETYAARDCGRKVVPVQKKFAHTVMLQVPSKIWGRNWHGLKSGHPRGRDGTRGLAFEHGDVWSVYNKITFGIGSHDLTIAY